MTANWRVRIAETISGAIVSEVQPADLPTFTRELCAKGDWSVSLITNNRAHQNLDLNVYATSDAYSWIIDCDGYICQAGPVTSFTYDEDSRKLSVSGTGIGALFDSRVLRNPAGNPAQGASTGNDITYANLTLASIMGKVVADNLAQANYQLPITVPDPVTGTATRTYYGYDFATVWSRMSDLAEVIDGPEFEFAPYYWRNGTTESLGWRLSLGAPALGDPELNAVWDYGGALGTITVDGNCAVGPIHRAWVKGSGDKYEMLVGYAEDSDALFTLGYPGTDYVDGDHTSVTEAATATAHAQADLAEHAHPIETWTASVRIDGRSKSGIIVSPTLGSWDVGDTPVFRVDGHPWITDGSYRRRILAFASDTESTVSLTIGEFPLIV